MNNDDRVQEYYYDPDEAGVKRQSANTGNGGNGRKGPGGHRKGFVTFAVVLAVILVIALLGSRILGKNDESYKFHDDYIGVLKLQGDISDNNSSSDPYNQKWLTDRITDMTEDPLNKGLIIDMNTPGGTIYATDELYLKVLDYKEKTGNPVYTYMESMAASGGYYIACASDKIYANRNTWTGSIGVTVGTFYDISELLSDIGIKTVTITSGDNKSMGNPAETMTEEQKDIFQGLVDDAYERFAGIVAEGRSMKLSEVKKLADGRVYTAGQAKENGLIDEIGSLEDAVKDMKDTYEIKGAGQIMEYKPKTSILNLFAESASGKAGEYEKLIDLAEESSKLTITYMAPINK